MLMKFFYCPDKKMSVHSFCVYDTACPVMRYLQDNKIPFEQQNDKTRYAEIAWQKIDRNYATSDLEKTLQDICAKCAGKYKAHTR